MKNRIYTIIIALLATITIQAQSVQVGDTITINPEYTHYLTGEKISTWVYKVTHTVQQVGSTRFPNGYLIRGILSWVGPEALDQQESANKEPQETNNAPLEQKAEPQSGMPVSNTVAIDSTAHTDPQSDVEQTGTVSQPTDSLYSTKPVIVQGQQTEPFIVEQEEKPTMNQYNRLTLGVRGGAASLLHKANQLSSGFGGDALLDIQYAHYWETIEKKNCYGILTGLAIGYVESSLGDSIRDQYAVTTDGVNINYTISANDVREHDGQIQLEIPLLFSMVMSNGFFLNAGPKLTVPVYGLYRQNIQNPNIKAEFPDYGVTVENEVITGLVSNNQMKTRGQWKPATIHIALTAELGYEWKLNNGNALGLGVYANYGLWSLYSNNTSNKSLINVTPPAGDVAADVSIESATDTYNNKIGYLDAGIKVAYHFNLKKKKE